MELNLATAEAFHGRCEGSVNLGLLLICDVQRQIIYNNDIQVFTCTNDERL